MKNWGFWDWTAYICLGMAILIGTLEQALERAPRVAAILPSWVSDPFWGFAPFVLFLIGSAILVLKVLRDYFSREVSNAALDIKKQERLQDKQDLRREELKAQQRQPIAAEPPRPIFGCPRQHAGEPFRSWWHIPITVSESPPGQQNVIEHCTVELSGGSGLPVRMQWQQDGVPVGVQETTLLDGRTRFVPIALRDEPSAGDKRIDACITGIAFLVQKENKFSLRPGNHVYRLFVRSGKERWESPHRYVIKVPQDNVSNGHFTVEVWHEGSD